MAGGLLLALASAGALASACHRAPVVVETPAAPPIPSGQVWLTEKQVNEAKIAIEPVAEQNVDDTILTSGRVTFDDLRVAHVFSPVTGKVVRIDAQLGQRVKKGQPLATIESPEIGSAVSDLHKAEADLIAAEHDYKRQKDLAEKHAASQKDLETSEDNYRKAKAEIERAKQKAYLLRTGGVNTVTQTYTLTSQIDGEVIARAVNPGIEVQGQYGGGAAVELFTVGELDKVWIIADIYEMDLSRVKVGSRASVKVVAYKDRVFDGKVDWVSGTLDPSSRTAKIRCTFENADKALKPEMYATVLVHVEERKALAIPRSSLVRLGDATVVFVEQGKAADGRLKFERLPVAVDEGESSNWLPVSHGLEAGQRIVAGGAILLSGML
jgi:cobalt-zinc-cadmium efflux system membrane fusion protein